MKRIEVPIYPKNYCNPHWADGNLFLEELKRSLKKQIPSWICNDTIVCAWTKSEAKAKYKQLNIIGEITKLCCK